MGRLTAEFSAATLKRRPIVAIGISSNSRASSILFSRTRPSPWRFFGAGTICTGFREVGRAGANAMLRTRATGLLSGRQMTASPFSSAPVATTNCSDEPLAVSFWTVGIFCAGPDAPALSQLENCSALRSAFSRGRPAGNRVVFINSGGMRRREGKAPENRTLLTWPYALRSL